MSKLSEKAQRLMIASHTVHDFTTWSALYDYIAELEAENAELRLIPQPLQRWTEEKKQIYEDSKIRSEKS